MRRLPPALLLPPLLALIAVPAVASAQQGEPMQGDSRDIPAIIGASEEAGSRAEERFPDAPDTSGEACPWHRDGFYTMGPGTEGTEEGTGQARPPGN